jgi:hypothetical protein
MALGILQGGQGLAYKDGVLGSVLASGPGRASGDGVFGRPAQGIGEYFTATNGLGAYYSYPVSAQVKSSVSGCGCTATNGLGDSAPLLQLTSDSLFYMAIGGVIGYFACQSKLLGGVL